MTSIERMRTVTGQIVFECEDVKETSDFTFSILHISSLEFVGSVEPR
jgi:hypothetical protein